MLMLVHRAVLVWCYSPALVCVAVPHSGPGAIAGYSLLLLYYSLVTYCHFITFTYTPLALFRYFLGLTQRFVSGFFRVLQFRSVSVSNI